MATLFDDAGGMEGLHRLSALFYQRVLADPLLAPVFASFTPTHVERVAVWLAEVLRGPEEYTGRLGGHHALLASHLGLGIREEHRQRWLDLIAQAIDEVLPGQPRLRDALMAYFDWGTAIARDVSHDPVGTDLGKPGPTPRWGYDGLIT